jgi:beta-lactamase family protein
VTLDRELRELVADRAGTWGVYARNLGTGETVAIDADVVMPAQSSLKTGVLVAYERRVDQGTIEPNRRVPLTADDVELGSGVLRYLAPGLEPTLDDLAWLMITVSDNVATRVLVRELGAAAIDAELDRLGLPSARTNDPLPGTSAQFRSSARDLAELYTHLGPRSREILYRHQLLDLLPRHLPHVPDMVDHGLTAPVRVYGKAGWGACELVDAGLFETDSAAWVVAGMARDLPDLWHRPDYVGPRTLADIGAACFRAWGGDASEWH